MTPLLDKLALWWLRAMIAERPGVAGVLLAELNGELAHQTYLDYREAPLNLESDICDDPAAL